MDLKMSASGFRVLKKVNVRCLILKLLLFQMLVTWCGAKHVAINRLPEIKLNDIEAEVQDSIRNLMHTGIYSHQHLDSSQTQVVTPVKVTFDGKRVAGPVDHTHAHGHARARRDLHGADHLLPHTLHYNLTLEGRDLRLDLRPSVTFITPALMIETHEAGGRTRQRPHHASTGCHYTGSVRGQPSSTVALSACDGLAGLLLTEHGEYWIEPSTQESNFIEGAGRPHVVFRRSAVDKVEAYHRAKRAVEKMQNTRSPHARTHAPQYSNRKDKTSRETKEAMDRRRREYLEARSRRLESLRRNPTEYRRQQMRLRMEQRRKEYMSRSSSLQSNSESKEQALIRNRIGSHSRGMHQPKPRRIRPRRRRKKRSKNCATKQPPYQWNKKNHEGKGKTGENNQNSPFSNHHRQPNRHGWNNTRRSARSVSRPRHVEVLLVADRSMTSFHNKSNIETYLLTIMNMVSSLYMDPSIGNYIKVVVVKIILVKEMNTAPGLNVSTNADETLTSFCQWQQQLNPDDDTNPHHHDVAILITRQDICSQHDIPCSTLGVAHVAGMCKPERSCSVNEDNGIMLAHTITHELGHNFGLYHDTEKIGCRRREGSTLHIMTPIFEADTRQVAWSRCSKRDVTNFLDAGMGECLGDRPSQEEYVYPEVPAGVTFDAATQCHLEFGAEAVVCADPAELCEHLWCLVNNTCKTMLRPAAPGTTCGPDMWCQEQKCVGRVPSPAPRDGGWGPWSEWSECSRTCGAGVSTQYRECNNPEPLNNGNYCIGDRSRYKVCNTEACPINEPTFREVQCSKFVNTTYNNETIDDWVPYFDQDKPCELKCVPKDRNMDVELSGGFAADGTPCRQSLSTRDMCIAGVCYKVGCDWIVDSNVEEDACGTCGGDGSACKTVQGIYSKDTTKQSGFSEVAVIPAGSRNVKIQEKVNPGNYISIGSAKTRRVYLNGARNTTLSEYFVAGSQAIYERDRDWEKVRIPGPIAEDIKVFQRIYRGRHRNPGVTYQYTVDRQRVEKHRRYRLSDWSACSVTCGTGYTRRYLQCLDDHDRVVEMSQCYHIEPPRHEALMAQCSAAPCPAPPRPTPPPTPRPTQHPTPRPTQHPTPRPTPAHAHAHWWVGPWDHCSDKFGNNELSKQRSVYCVDKISNTVIDESMCERATRPINRIRCGEKPSK